MLSKCSNPSCSALFSHLQDGKLFSLESVPVLDHCAAKRVEHFWLCENCSLTMSLRLAKDERVVVPLPRPFRSVPGEVSVVSSDRKKGLLLRTVSSYLPLTLTDHKGTRLKGASDAAWLEAT
jgi:hypothetical protein